MPNIYSKPVSSNFRNTYTSQFVPLPLEQFAKTNELNQARQDSEVAQLSNTSDAGHKISGAAKEDNEYVASKLVEFDTASGQLANMDLTRRENQDAAKSLVRNLSRDKDLLTIISNRAKVDEYQKNLAESKKDGTYHPANDIGMLSINDYSASGGYKSGKSIDPSIYKYQNTRPVKEEFFNNMGENGSDSIKQAGEVFYKDGFKGITEGRVNKRAMQAYQGYAATTAADQDRREYDYGVRTGTINPKSTSREAYVFKGFLDAGLERVHGVSDSGRAAALNVDKDKKEKKAKEEKEEKEKKEGLNLFGNLPTAETPSTMFNGYNVEFDDKGQIKGSGRPFSEVWKESSGVVDFFKRAVGDTRPNDEEKMRHINVEAGAKLNNMSPKAYADIYNRPSHMVVKEPLVGKALTDNTKALFNGGAGLWSGLNIRNNDTGDSNMTFIDAMKKVADNKGISMPDPESSPDKFAEFVKSSGISITGLATPNEFSLKPVIFTVAGNEFVADLTQGGKHLPYDNSTATGKKANQEAQKLANFDKLMKGQLVPGVYEDKKGVYFRNLNKLNSQGQPSIDFKSE